MVAIRGLGQSVPLARRVFTAKFGTTVPRAAVSSCENERSHPTPRLEGAGRTAGRRTLRPEFSGPLCSAFLPSGLSHASVYPSRLAQASQRDQHHAEGAEPLEPRRGEYLLG